jgi:hypothetical protein
MAADDIAKGALNLIRWGKKIIPATEREIARYGKNAPRITAMLQRIRDIPTIDYIPGMDPDSGYTILNKAVSAKPAGTVQELKDAWRNADSQTSSGSFQALDDAERWTDMGIATSKTLDATQDAVLAAAFSDLITPQTYRTLTQPMALVSSLQSSAARAPEGFGTIARNLSELNMLNTPQDVRIARQISQLPPEMQQVYLNLLGEDTDPVQLLQALRLMGQ